jgi:3',5'-cyclic AMP phosphodiesterase CpdA
MSSPPDTPVPPVPISPGVTRIAVMGDLHFYRLWVAPWRLLSKRILGQINLWWDRRHNFDRALLAPMLQHVVDINPAMFLLTGDITMTSLMEEFDDVRLALDVVGGRFPVLAVPGNHDRYTPFSKRRRVMERCMPGLIPPAFPHLQALSPRWKLLALDAAMPRLLSARGVVGRDQLAAAEAEVRRLTRDEGLVVMCHYPAIEKPTGHITWWNHRLADAAAVPNVLGLSKAPIVYVHGHVHWPWVARKAGGIGHMTDINVGAPIMRKGDYPFGQGFWELELPDDPAAEPRFIHHVPIAGGFENGRIVLDWARRVTE